jgi:acetyl-CoA carboxylase biotin carboxyl carrier protein
MEAAEIEQVARWLEEAGIAVLDITGPARSIRITMDGAGTADLPSPAVSAGGSRAVVAAASPGTFRDRHPLHGTPLASEGQAVKAGDIIGLVEAGGVFVPVTARADGTIVRRLAEPGTLVGFGTPLWELAAA